MAEKVNSHQHQSRPLGGTGVRIGDLWKWRQTGIPKSTSYWMRETAFSQVLR